MIEKIKVRKLKKGDFKKGFFESLSNLFKVGLSVKEAGKIFERIRRNPTYHIFVAEINNEIVGVTTLLVEQKFLLKGAVFGYIEDVAVRKGFERRGIGKLLVKTAIKEADKEGCAKLRLDCSEENAPFYEKCGFYKKKALRMQLDLRKISV